VNVDPQLFYYTIFPQFCQESNGNFFDLKRQRCIGQNVLQKNYTDSRKKAVFCLTFTFCAGIGLSIKPFGDLTETNESKIP